MPSTRNAPLRGTLVNEASNLAAACLENGDTRCALHASQHPGGPLLASGDAAAALAAAQVSETGLFGWHADGKATSPQRRRSAWTQPTQAAALRRLGRPVGAGSADGAN